MGNEVRKYRESPALALRVEIPFSSTTATRVPAGTVILSLGPARLSTAGRTSGPTGAGADVCGPSGCCAKAELDETTISKICEARIASVRFTASLHAVFRCEQQRYGCPSIRSSRP